MAFPTLEIGRHGNPIRIMRMPSNACHCCGQDVSLVICMVVGWFDEYMLVAAVSLSQATLRCHPAMIGNTDAPPIPEHTSAIVHCWLGDDASAWRLVGRTAL